MHHGDFVKIKNLVRIVEILDRKSRLFENAEYYYLHNAPRIVEIIVLHWCEHRSKIFIIDQQHET